MLWEKQIRGTYSAHCAISVHSWIRLPMVMPRFPGLHESALIDGIQAAQEEEHLPFAGPLQRKGGVPRERPEARQHGTQPLWHGVRSHYGTNRRHRNIHLLLYRGTADFLSEHSIPIKVINWEHETEEVHSPSSICIDATPADNHPLERYGNTLSSFRSGEDRFVHYSSLQQPQQASSFIYE